MRRLGKVRIEIIKIYRNKIKDYKAFKAYANDVLKSPNRNKELKELELDCLKKAFFDYYVLWQLDQATEIEK